MSQVPGSSCLLLTVFVRAGASCLCLPAAKGHGEPFGRHHLHERQTQMLNEKLPNCEVKLILRKKAASSF